MASDLPQSSEESCSRGTTVLDVPPQPPRVRKVRFDGNSGKTSHNQAVQPIVTYAHHSQAPEIDLASNSSTVAQSADDHEGCRRNEQLKLLESTAYTVDDVTEEVAALETSQSGVKQVILIELRKVFHVGRSAVCNYMVASKLASAKHFRLYAHKTDSNDVLVSCEDLSRNGIVWNGRLLRHKSVLLTHGDIIEIPKAQSFVYKHLSSDGAARAGEVEPEAAGQHEMVLGGRYHIRNRVLGSGQFAEVFLAWDAMNQDQVACKRQIKRYDTEFMLNEINVLQQIRHENVNAMVGWHEDDVYAYFFVNTAAGGDLFNFISQGRCLSEPEAIFITYQLLHGLRYLHGSGIAHLDVKPENVLVLTAASRFPHVQLADVGMAWIDHRVTSSQAGKDHRAQETSSPRCYTDVGTLSYTSPEQLRRRITEEAFDPYMADAWSLGVVVFVMLTGSHPFDCRGLYDDPEIMRAIEEAVVGEGDPTTGEGKPHSTHSQEREAGYDLPDEAAKERIERHAKTARAFVRKVFRQIHLSHMVEAGSLPSQEAATFIQGQLTIDLTRRVSVQDAFHTAWIQNSAEDLEVMYDVKVSRRALAERYDLQGKQRKRSYCQDADDVASRARRMCLGP